MCRALAETESDDVAGLVAEKWDLRREIEDVKRELASDKVVGIETARRRS